MWLHIIPFHFLSLETSQTEWLFFSDLWLLLLFWRSWRMYSWGHLEASSSHWRQNSLCILSPCTVSVLCAVLARRTNIFLFCHIWKPACTSSHSFRCCGIWGQATPRTSHTCQKGWFASCSRHRKLTIIICYRILGVSFSILGPF